MSIFTDTLFDELFGDYTYNNKFDPRILKNFLNRTYGGYRPDSQQCRRETVIHSYEVNGVHYDVLDTEG